MMDAHVQTVGHAGHALVRRQEQQMPGVHCLASPVRLHVHIEHQQIGNEPARANRT